VAHASEKTQNFVSEWTVGPWNYYGDTAAMEWQYITHEPWDTTLGELREVRVTTEFLGELESRGDDVRIRHSFFDGWSPANYQLSSHSYISISDTEFLASMSFVYDTPEELEQWHRSDTAPLAHYYFESRSKEAGHAISAVTTLTYIYDSLPDLMVLELTERVLTYEESSALSSDTSNALLRNLDRVLTHIDQNEMHQACEGINTFSQTTEELANDGGIEYAASMLLIADADQVAADLCKF
jgi:hypothetical protein